MQGTARVPRKGQHEFLHQLRIEGAHLLRGDVHLIAQAVPSAQVHRAQHQRLIHGQQEMAVAHDAPLVPQRLEKCLAQRDADVLHGMMIVHLRVSLAAQGQIELPVEGQQLQHVVEKAHAGRNVRLSGPVQVQRQGDSRFFGISLDGCASHGAISSFVTSISRCI